MPTDGERIATLETLATEAKGQRNEIVTKLDRQDTDLAAIRADVGAIKEAIASYRGFASGALFAVTMLGGLIGALAAALWNRVFPHH